jgi:hypothetical protein
MIRYGGAIALGILLGLASIWAMVISARWSGETKAGAWSMNMLTGSAAADPYTRAIVARVGLLALKREETVYYTAYTDDAGATLEERCRYELRGGPLPARWWSITLYDGENFLARNDDGAGSVDQTRVITADGNSYQIRVSHDRDGWDGNWLSSRGAGSFSLTIRLYHPAPSVLARPGAVKLPSIRRLECPR